MKAFPSSQRRGIKLHAKNGGTAMPRFTVGARVRLPDEKTNGLWPARQSRDESDPR